MCIVKDISSLSIIMSVDIYSDLKYIYYSKKGD